MCAKISDIRFDVGFALRLLFSAFGQISLMLNDDCLYFSSLVICEKGLLQILLLLQQPLVLFRIFTE